MRLKQIGLALWTYQDEYGSLPPAAMKGSNGIPIHSWRIQCLPSFSGLKDVYRKYRFDEPWNGPNNSRFQTKYPSIGRGLFSCPTSGLPWTHTNYVAVTGAATVWPDSGTVVITEQMKKERGVGMVVEVPNMNINWLGLKDISLEELISIINSDNSEDAPIHDAGFPYVDTRLNVRWIPRKTSAADLRKIFSIPEPPMNL